MKRREFIGCSRRGDPVAAGGARAAKGDAGDRVPGSTTCLVQFPVPPGARSAKAWGEAGYVEGQDWRSNTAGRRSLFDRLPALAADLVRRQVRRDLRRRCTPQCSRRKRRPRQFRSSSRAADDPVKIGFVASLNRPGGNVTGLSFNAGVLVAQATRVAVRAGAPGQRDRPCSST